MSLQFLNFGLNIKNKLKEQEKEKNKEEQEQLLISNTFPNCVEDKRKILIIKKKIEKLKTSDDIEKLKEKKLQMLVNQLHDMKKELLEKLAIHSETEIDPLCSFEEVQK
jgi:hypothetical protein